jgi:hypothetical protein
MMEYWNIVFIALTHHSITPLFQSSCQYGNYPYLPVT